MTTYSKITDFAAKDALLTGNPAKIVKGTEIGAEFDAIALADASNAKGPSPGSSTDNAVVRWDTTTGRLLQNSLATISDAGVVTAPGFVGPLTGNATTASSSTTQSAGDNSTAIATTAFVSTLVGGIATAVSSLSGNGYQKLPSGLIVQWGTGTTNGSGVLTVTMPLTFPTTWYVALAHSYGSGANINCATASQSATTLIINAYTANTAVTAGSTPVSWIAIGK